MLSYNCILLTCHFIKLGGTVIRSAIHPALHHQFTVPIVYHLPHPPHPLNPWSDQFTGLEKIAFYLKDDKTKKAKGDQKGPNRKDGELQYWK